MVLGDIDHFKLINDCYGHPAGDAVLCAVAHAMASQLLPGESLARWGGEEFLLILPGCTIERAALRAEQLRQQVCATRLPWQGEQISITISLGCASMKSQESLDNLLMMADQALYQAKAQGRNRVVISAQ